MRIVEIESWALRIVADVEKGNRVEDARVELKSEFPPPSKAARRIAAHANSSFSEPVLWLIGVSETNGVVGIDVEEMANWWPKVISAFDGVYPSMQDVVVSTKRGHVRCLLFSTERAPFVVKNPTGEGVIQREVPWREGTTTRTATREELIRILHPDIPVPDVELLGGTISAYSPHSIPDQCELTAKLKAYLVPRNSSELVIPFHRCTGRIFEDSKLAIEDGAVAMGAVEPSSRIIRPLSRRFLGEQQPQSVTIRREAESMEADSHQAIFYRPAMFHVTVRAQTSKAVWASLVTPRVEISMRFAHDTARVLRLAAVFKKRENGLLGFGELVL